MTQFYQPTQMPARVVVIPQMHPQQQFAQYIPQQQTYNQLLIQQQAQQLQMQQQQQQQQQQHMLATQPITQQTRLLGNVAPPAVFIKPVTPTLSPRKTKTVKKDVKSCDDKKLEKHSIPCTHNSWDNVRVSKKRMTLRCRICQQQWRETVDRIWGDLKCDAFTATSNCPKGDNCELLHLHYRKLTLAERTKRGLVPAETVPNLDKVESVLDEEDMLSCPSLCEEEEELGECRMVEVAEISSQAPTVSDCSDFSARSHFYGSNASMESLLQCLGNRSPKGPGVMAN